MSKNKQSPCPAPPAPDAASPVLPGAQDDIGESLRQLGAAAPPLESHPAQPEGDAACALNQDPQLVQDFLVESREHLTNIEARMLEIEQGAETGETINSAFRSFHTIKGLAG
ncbi:MAG: Hpt domain-containing protein, partial [Bryobacteraceae bacterium]|nr:Hpt domain-containing protein [Bryobacteraceae bacterium]